MFTTLKLSADRPTTHRTNRRTLSRIELLSQLKKKSLPIFKTQIFHNSFLSKRFGAGHDEEDPDNEESNVEDEDGTDVAQEDFAAPASPGMEHLLRKQMEANKKLPKNVKYNKAFDVAELCAEYLKDTPNQLFEVHLDSFKGFASLLRDGYL